jgi:hypothetical protein
MARREQLGMLAEVIVDAGWVDRGELARYLDARRRAAGLVADALRAVGFAGSVGGSWSRGDFHLTPSGLSASDLDLVDGDADSDLDLRAAELAELLARRGLSIPVSIHPSDSFLPMSMADQRYFNLLEHLLATLDGRNSYGAAKATLMLSRRDTSESGLEAGVRLGLLDVVRVKLGVGDTFATAVGTVDRFVEMQVGGRTIAEWSDNPTRSLAQLAHHFAAREAATGAWIYRRGRAKAQAAVDRTATTGGVAR